MGDATNSATSGCPGKPSTRDGPRVETSTGTVEERERWSYDSNRSGVPGTTPMGSDASRTEPTRPIPWGKRFTCAKCNEEWIITEADGPYRTKRNQCPRCEAPLVHHLDEQWQTLWEADAEGELFPLAGTLPLCTGHTMADTHQEIQADTEEDNAGHGLVDPVEKTDSAQPVGAMVTIESLGNSSAGPNGQVPEDGAVQEEKSEVHSKLAESLR